MYVYKNFNLINILRFSGGHIIWLTLWATAVTIILTYAPLSISIPWRPLGVIGIAVAFYVGFKNNSSYGRLWEARKIWGAIVNSSRAWGSNIRSYISNQFASENLSEDQLKQWHKKLIYRHLGWIYSLRSQLLIPTPWEHISQGKHVRRITELRRKRFGIGLVDDGATESILKQSLPTDEYQQLIEYQNTATQIIDRQSQDLQELRRLDLIDDFRHMELQKILNDFYTFQGQCERIKKFPFPRQYGSVSFIFIALFIFLLPIGMVSEFAQLGEYGGWLSIPFTVLIGWVFVMMELVGDYSENPFEGLGNDIPMLSICRTIEIDLKEMLGEADVPAPIEAKNGVLM